MSFFRAAIVMLVSRGMRTHQARDRRWRENFRASVSCGGLGFELANTDFGLANTDFEVRNRRKMHDDAVTG